MSLEDLRSRLAAAVHGLSSQIARKTGLPIERIGVSGSPEARGRSMPLASRQPRFALTVANGRGRTAGHHGRSG